MYIFMNYFQLFQHIQIKKRTIVVTLLICLCVAVYHSDIVLFRFVDAIDSYAGEVLHKDRPLKLHAIRNKVLKLVDELNPLYTDAALQKAPLKPIALTLSPKDLLFFEEALKEALTVGSVHSSLFEEDRKVDVSYDGKAYRTTFALHGQSDNHYKYRKKSYKLKFLDTYLPDQFISWRLLIPDDRGYFSPFISNYINEQLGLPTVKQFFSRVSINNIPYGIYYTEEKYDAKFLERNKLSGGIIIDFDAARTPYRERERFDPTFLESLVFDEESPIQEKDVFPRIEAFFRAIEQGDEETVLSYLDQDRTAAFEAWRAILGMQHDIENPNLRFVYMPSSGTFFPLTRLEGEIGTTGDPLRSHFFDVLDRSSEMNAKRDAYIAALIDHERDILSYYDSLNSTYGPAILADNSISRARRVREWGIRTDREELVSNIAVWRTRLSLHESEADSAMDENITPPLSSFDEGGLSFVYNSQKNVYEVPVGRYHITEDLVVYPHAPVIFSRGTQVSIDPGISVVLHGSVFFEGTEEQPIIISSYGEEPYGVFAIQGINKECHVDASYLDISRGSEAVVQGVYYSGGFDIYHCDATLSQVRVTEHDADDGLNIKYGDVSIEDSVFMNNAADQVDLDITTGVVERSIFEKTHHTGDANGDGLDVSGSLIRVVGSSFTGFDDKGMSVGEESVVWVRDNILSTNTLGIAVKDNSKAYIDHNTFFGNIRDIDAYQKKPVFGGSHVFIRKGSNVETYQTDHVSQISIAEEDIFLTDVNALFYEN